MTKKQMPAQRPGSSEQGVRTPKVFLDAVRVKLGITDFVMDLAATKANRVTAEYYSRRDDALTQMWPSEGVSFLNPPYANISPWVEKAYHESEVGSTTSVLIPAAVGANYWAKWVHEKAHVFLLNGRIQFVGHTHGYPKDLVLLIYGPHPVHVAEPWRIPGYEVWRWKP